MHTISRALVVNQRDNVAVALMDIIGGQQVLACVKGKTKRIYAIQDVSKGHKIALVGIAKGKPILKYGEVIGYAKKHIRPGQFVHSHNVVGRDEMM